MVMKLILLPAVFVALWSITSGLVCLVCEDAANHRECLRKGRQELCHQNQLACQTEIRYLPNKSKRINKRCKQANACFNDSPQIFTNRPTSSECDVGKPGEVCRCCCYKDGCSNDESTSCPKDFTPPVVTTPVSYTEPSCPAFNLGLQARTKTRYCTQGFKSGSACRLRCPFPYQLQGISYISCQKVNVHVARWTNDPPCCTKFCPPFGNMDLLIGFDSSQMDTGLNWQRARRFVRNIVRFSDKPEVATAISLGDHESQRDFLASFNAIAPTRKKFNKRRYGPALQFALKEAGEKREFGSNRRSIFLLITSGPCDDVVQSSIYSKWLKDSGIQVMSLGFSTRRQDFQPLQRQLKAISHKDHMVSRNMSTQAYNFLLLDIMQVFQTQLDQIHYYTDSAVRMVCSNTCGRS